MATDEPVSETLCISADLDQRVVWSDDGRVGDIRSFRRVGANDSIFEVTDAHEAHFMLVQWRDSEQWSVMEMTNIRSHQPPRTH